MARIRVIAQVSRRERNRRKRTLKISTTQERAIVPVAGDTIVLCSMGASNRSVSLRAIERRLEWGENGQENYLILATGEYKHLVHLAIVCGWKVLAGHNSLSTDQQSFVACAEGACGDHQHT